MSGSGHIRSARGSLLREDMLSSRVLVIDADVLVARAIGRALSASHDVAIEIDPRCALHRLANEHFDIVLCEQRAAANQIQKALQRRPQFVLMSGSELEPGESDGFLRKPFDDGELHAMIDALVSRSSR